MGVGGWIGAVVLGLMGLFTLYFVVLIAFGTFVAPVIDSFTFVRRHLRRWLHTH